MAVMAGVLAALACWLWTGPPAARARLSALWRAGAAGGRGDVLLVGLGLRSPGDAGARGAALAPPPRPLDDLVGRLVRMRRVRRMPARRSVAVVELCDGIGAELAAGRTPEQALAASVAVLDPELVRDLFGGRPPSLDGAELPRVPGGAGLRLLAACWRVGAERGATFASAVDGLATALRGEQAARAEVAAQLAGPRATARLLAALPVLGLGMAAAMGAHPVAFLLTTPPGLGCTALGMALDAVGLWWTDRIARAAEHPR